MMKNRETVCGRRIRMVGAVGSVALAMASGIAFAQQTVAICVRQTAQQSCQVCENCTINNDGQVIICPTVLHAAACAGNLIAICSTANGGSATCEQQSLPIDPGE